VVHQGLVVVGVNMVPRFSLLQEIGPLLTIQMFPAIPVMLVLQGVAALEAQVVREVVTPLPLTPMLT